MFEGVVGASFLSDIALDDIRVYAGPCEGENLVTLLQHVLWPFVH